MDRGDRKTCLEAGGDTLPPDHKATIFLLEPGKGALGLEPRHDFFDRSAPVFLCLPDTLRDLRPDPSLPELLPQCFGILPFLGRDDLEAFTRTSPFARADLHGIQQRQHLCPLVPLGRGDAIGQGHAAPLGEAVEEAPLALPPVGDARAATLARGKKRHPRRHTPNASSRVLPQSPECGLASPPACHPPATAATNEASRSATPIAARVAQHTTDNR